MSAADVIMQQPLILPNQAQEVQQSEQAPVKEFNSIVFNEVDANYKITKISDSLKNNGYDENFKTELYDKKVWKKSDEKFNLVNKEENFTNAYRNSRLPTNSYIHFAQVKNGKIETDEILKQKNGIFNMLLFLFVTLIINISISLNCCSLFFYLHIQLQISFSRRP